MVEGDSTIKHFNSKFPEHSLKGSNGHNCLIDLKKCSSISDSNVSIDRRTNGAAQDLELKSTAVDQKYDAKQLNAFGTIGQTLKHGGANNGNGGGDSNGHSAAEQQHLHDGAVVRCGAFEAGAGSSDVVAACTGGGGSGGRGGPGHHGPGAGCSAKCMDAERCAGGSGGVVLKADFEQAIELAGYGKFHYILLAICGLVSTSEEMDVISMSFILPSAQCDLHLNTQTKGWLNSIIFIGMMVGAYFWGSLADTMGRKRVLIVISIMNALCIVASSFTQTYALFMVFRFLNGVA